MQALGPIQGAQQQVAQQRTIGPEAQAAAVKGAQGPGSHHPGGFAPQHEQITVEEQQLEGEGPRHPQPLQGGAHLVKAGDGH